MNKPIAIVTPNIRSGPIIPDLGSLDIEQLRELYFQLDRACWLLSKKKEDKKLYKKYLFYTNLVVKRLAAIIDL